MAVNGPGGLEVAAVEDGGEGEGVGLDRLSQHSGVEGEGLVGVGVSVDDGSP